MLVKGREILRLPSQIDNLGFYRTGKHIIEEYHFIPLNVCDPPSEYMVMHNLRSKYAMVCLCEGATNIWTALEIISTDREFKKYLIPTEIPYNVRRIYLNRIPGSTLHQYSLNLRLQRIWNDCQKTPVML